MIFTFYASFSKIPQAELYFKFDLYCNLILRNAELKGLTFYMVHVTNFFHFVSYFSKINFLASLLQTHNNGKKHQRLLKLKQERESSSRRSIYVRGFQNSGSIEEDLGKYFSVYGKVSNIFLDKDKVF